MRKHTLILTAITVLALAAMSCGIQFVPPDPPPAPGPQGVGPQGVGPQNGDPGPQGPGPQGVSPQGAGPQNPVPQGPIPNSGNPGQGQILSFTADQTTIQKGECVNLHWETQGGFGVKLNSQPVPAVGQQQVCPPQTTAYGLGLDTGSQMLTGEVTITVTGGNQNSNPIATTVTPSKSKPKGGKTVTETPSFPSGSFTIRRVDLGISRIYPAANGHIMVTIQNNGNDTVNTNISLSCSGTVTYKGKNGSPDVTGQLGPYVQNVGFKLGAGEKFDQDTQLARDPTVRKLVVTCSLTPPPLDNNSSNNSKGPVTVKDQT